MEDAVPALSPGLDRDDLTREELVRPHFRELLRVPVSWMVGALAPTSAFPSLLPRHAFRSVLSSLL